MAVDDYVTTEKADRELSHLFTVYRTARLNVLYYGKRAKHFMDLRRRWLIGIGLLSAVALTIALSAESLPKDWQLIAKLAAVLAAGVAGVGAAILPSFGWDECARDLHFLHVAYGILFGQLELAMVKIKKRGDVTPELDGEAQTLYETFSRLEPMDEKFPDVVLIDKMDESVRAQFPPDYIWKSL